MSHICFFFSEEELKLHEQSITAKTHRQHLKEPEHVAPALNIREKDVTCCWYEGKNGQRKRCGWWVKLLVWASVLFTLTASSVMVAVLNAKYSFLDACPVTATSTTQIQAVGPPDEDVSYNMTSPATLSSTAGTVGSDCSTHGEYYGLGKDSKIYLTIYFMHIDLCLYACMYSTVYIHAISGDGFKFQ